MKDYTAQSRVYCKYTKSEITVRELRADGWTLKEIEVSSYEEYFEAEPDSESWDRDDPEFWDLLFSQRPSWERD